MLLPVRQLSRAALAVGVVLLALGCKSAEKAPPPMPPYGPVPPPAPYPAYTPPAAPQPLATPAPVPAPAPVSAALVAKARPALGVSTLEDDVILLVSIQGEDGYLTEAHPLGREKIQLSALRFVVSVRGAQNVELSAGGLPGGAVELRHHAAMALRIHQGGVSLVSWMAQAGTETAAAPWEAKPPEPVLAKAGEYEVDLAVEIPLPGGKRVVKANTMKLERRVRGRTTAPVRGIEEIAKGAAFIHLNKLGRTDDQKKLSPTLLTVDLPQEKHHRLVRFWVPEKEEWKILFLEVVVERNGTVVKVHQQERFTCLAEGTRIDSEHGPIPIEALERGDRVWSWDVERGRRVLSEVIAVSEPKLAPTMRLAGRLRVTGGHPIFADGRWVRAEELTLGAELLAASGEGVPLSLVEHGLASVPVYDATVSWPANFFAEGILVHNKRLVVPESRLDPLVVLWERAIGAFDLLAPKTN